MREPTYEKGLAGEEEALAYLIHRGMKLLQKRYSGESGEIDLVMRDGDVVAFVEVKLRLTGEKGSGVRAVTPEKQRRIIKTARRYAYENRVEGMMRFDVLEITRDGVWYIPNAFMAPSWG